MPASRSVVAWITLVLGLGAVALVTVVATLGGVGPNIAIAVALVIGVVASVLLPIRYRLGGSTHGLTVDEAMLVAMLVSLPGAWPPVVHVTGVAIGHLLRRTPVERLTFNVGLVGLSSSIATLAYHVVAVPDQPFRFASLVAAVVAMGMYAIVSGTFIAALFSRLGASTFWQGVREVLPVSRVTLPANIIGGLLLGWFATKGAVFVAIGVGLIVVLFVAYRSAVGARLQRDRVTRLRDVATALVGASGSFAAFDEALRCIAALFDAGGAELLLASGERRCVGVDEVGDEASIAARAGLLMQSPQSFAPGTSEGGAAGVLVAPIVAEGVPLGSLVVHGRRGLEFWDDADEHVLEGVAGEVIVALRNAELLAEVASERSRLAAQTELLGGILTAASDGIALFSTDGEILAWNPAMSVIAGLGDEAVLGRPWRDVLVVVGDTDDPLGDAIRQVLVGGPQARTWHIKPRDGDDRWVRARLTASKAGDRDGVVLVARDVTATREVERLKADFIATVSHELRTPLTPLRGFLELSLRKKLAPEQQTDMHVSMLRQVERLQLLVEDLLAAAQMEQETVDLSLAEVSLDAVASRIAANYAGSDRLTIAGATMTAMGDQDAIVRILDALVNNAMKHTDGHIWVSATVVAATVRVDVRDDGPGIRAADQEAIFERFHRLGDHLHRTQGPGLGLPIARALARQFGGDVTVTSTPGHGATFTALFRRPEWSVEDGAPGGSGTPQDVG